MVMVREGKLERIEMCVFVVRWCVEGEDLVWGGRGLLGESGAVVRGEKGSEGSITRDMYI